MGLKFIASIGECDCRWYLLQGTNWEHAVTQSEIRLSSSIDKNATIGVLPATVDNSCNQSNPKQWPSQSSCNGSKKTYSSFDFCVFSEIFLGSHFPKVRVGESVKSALSALAAIFSALSAYFNNFWQKIPYFDVSRQKRVLFNCFATKQCLGMLKMWG